MRFSKNASLNLSVNAIVVFVLAFSMLGVGLYVTNLIRENVGSGITSVVNIQDLKSPPSAEDPITVSREITLKKGKEIKIDIGYYNKNTEEATNAKIGIGDCIKPDGEQLILEGGGTSDDALLVVSPFAKSVGASEGKGYKVKIVDNSKNTGDPLTTGSYVCTMIVFDPALGTGWGSYDEPYESKQFFLNLVS
ncbi:MAG: hypothetical protein ABIG89_05370 [Candidatus Woesearchaeota archaeon]